MAPVTRTDALNAPRSAKLSPVRTAAEDADRAGFEGFAVELRGTLAPSNALECLLADRLIVAAWRLRELSEAEAAEWSDEGRRGPSVTPSRAGREARRAEQGLETALSLYQKVTGELGRTQGGYGVSPKTQPARREAAPALHRFEADDYPDLSNEWPQVDDAPRGLSGDDDDDHDHDDRDDEPVGWEDRLTVDPNVSQVSPVVRGTWVTVEQVVALVVDGWTWSDVLRTHPELTEADIRACLSYTVDHDEFGAY